MSLITKDDSFRYHACGAQGKACVVPTKPCSTQRHLSMAYTPGVADVCRAIHDDAACGYDYTNKGNLIAVVTNGTAVLGLGDIGPLAGKPVMEARVYCLRPLQISMFMTFALSKKTLSRLSNL